MGPSSKVTVHSGVDFALAKNSQFVEGVLIVKKTGRNSYEYAIKLVIDGRKELIYIPDLVSETET